jgi:hypothetical protein
VVLVGAGSSPIDWPALALMRLTMARQRSSSSRMSRASATASSGAEWIDRSSSLAAMAMVARGVPSSCAAPAASVLSEASFSLRAARLGAEKLHLARA